MIVETNYSRLEGNAPKQNFSIELNATMMDMLTAKIYNDPILAVIRELSTNAIDACIDAELPIKYEVNLPTLLKPEFSVRDYGTGLSPEDVTGLYSTLGASTKRGSNDFNGVFGLGRMSGLAYANSFNVDSYYNGTKYSYLISTDNGMPQIIQLGSTITLEPNGLRVYLPIKTTDISLFIEKASNLYKYFEDKPILNIELKNQKIIKEIEGDDWYLEDERNFKYYERQLLIIMGNVTYTINPSDLNSKISDLTQLTLRLNVPIGEVSITPGRESLAMDKKTISYLNKRLFSIKNEMENKFFEGINKEKYFWDKAVKFNETIKMLPRSIGNDITFTIPENKKDWFVSPHYNYSTDTIKLYNPENKDIAFQVFYKYLSNSKQLDSIIIDKTVEIMVGDIRTHIKEAINEYKNTNGNKNIIVLKPKKYNKDTFNDDIKNIEKFIKEKLEKQSYIKASDYYTSIVINKKTKEKEEINFYPIEFNINYQSTTYRSTQGQSINKYTVDKFYYVETNRQNVINMSEEKLSAYLRFVEFYKTLTENPESFMIIGIPKKGLKSIKNNPKFIPLEGALNHLIQDTIIVDYRENAILLKQLHLTTDYINELLKYKLPKDIKEYFTKFIEFDSKYKDKMYYNVKLDNIDKYFDIKYIKSDTKYTIDYIFNKYELLKELLYNKYSFNHKQIANYTLKEDYYKRNKNEK